MEPKRWRQSCLRLGVSVVDDIEEPVGQQGISNLGSQQSTTIHTLELGEVDGWKVYIVHWIQNQPQV